MHWIMAHLFGDYLFQNDWMALNKKKHNFHCAVHCTCYTVLFLAYTLDPWKIALIWLQHFLLDRGEVVGWICRVKGSGKFVSKDSPLFPWSWVVMDNVLHVLWLAFVLEIL